MSYSNHCLRVSLLAGLFVLSGIDVGPVRFNTDQAFAGNGNGGGNGGGNAGGNGGGNAGGNGGGNAGGNSGSGGSRSALAGNNDGGNTAARVGRSEDRGPPKTLKDVLFGVSKKPVRSIVISKIASYPKVIASNAGTKKAAKIELESDEPVEKAGKGKGALASKLGALNAAHASANAFAHAAPNSRVGLIRTYFLENAEADESSKLAAIAKEDFESAKQAFDDAVALKKLVEETPDILVDLNDQLDNAVLAGAEEDVATLTTQIQDAKDAAAAAVLKLEGVDVAALETAASDAQKAADQAALDAKAAEEEAIAALNDAANKPVTDEIRAALDELLKGKIIVPETTLATTG